MKAKDLAGEVYVLGLIDSKSRKRTDYYFTGQQARGLLNGKRIRWNEPKQEDRGKTGIDILRDAYAVEGGGVG